LGSASSRWRWWASAANRNFKRHLLSLGGAGSARIHLNEIVFRFNRRTSRPRGPLFYRLLQQAVVTGPVTYHRIAAGHCCNVDVTGGAKRIPFISIPHLSAINNTHATTSPPVVAALPRGSRLRETQAPYSHSIINSFGKSLIGLMQERQRLHAYRQNYRHFERDPRAQLSPSIDTYREQSALSQYSAAVELYRDLSRLRTRLLWREATPRSVRSDRGDAGIK
jgi:hypothetical protein